MAELQNDWLRRADNSPQLYSSFSGHSLVCRLDGEGCYAMMTPFRIKLLIIILNVGFIVTTIAVIVLPSIFITKSQSHLIRPKARNPPFGYVGTQISIWDATLFGSECVFTQQSNLNVPTPLTG